MTSMPPAVFDGAGVNNSIEKQSTAPAPLPKELF